MDKAHVVDVLRLHEAELRAAGILHLQLFGSVARGDATEFSDVDLVADLDRSFQPAVFGMAKLEHRLTELLGAKVELSIGRSMKQRVRERAACEVVHAF